jgi:uncharacterized protein YkwD
LFGLILTWLGKSNETPVTEIIPTLGPVLTATEIPKQMPRPTPSYIIKKEVTADPKTDDEWGIAKQIDEHTWTMKVGLDERMAEAKEVFDALNEYRRRNGVAVLMWDEKLANYAKLRAVYFNKIKKLDGHEGFANFLENENGFDVLGFDSVGENASYGYRMSGTHLIEWIYAGDKPHDDNQKNSKWAYVGIGINETSSCLIFGTGKR